MHPAQVPNLAGGFVFQLDVWKHAERFLILGAEGPSYYASAGKLTRDAAQSIEKCIRTDPERLAKMILGISRERRAAKPDPVLFALAMMARGKDLEARKVAYRYYPEIVTNGHSQLKMAAMMNDLGGWSAGSRRVASKWYTDKSDHALAYQVLKYQGRRMEQGKSDSRWTQRDVLRLAHPKPKGKAQQALFAWLTGKPYCFADMPQQARRYITLHEDPVTDRGRAVLAILNDGLTREMLPTEYLKHPEIWAALLGDHNTKFKMPMEAMIRNLGNMSKVGLLDRGSPAARFIADQLTDEETVQGSGLHPLKILVAMHQYRQGSGDRSSSTWTTNQLVVDALDNAFYLAFKNIQPSNKRIKLAVDISGSMDWPSNVIPGCGNITSRVGAAAMAMATVRSEPAAHVTAFSGNIRESTLTGVGIHPTDSLYDVVNRFSALPAGGTDCALPMLHATRAREQVDAFVIYTDNETWKGSIHPMEALRQYRRLSGINAKLVVVGMCATRSTIGAAQWDEGVLDVVGFDTAAPQLISDFIAGHF